MAVELEASPVIVLPAERERKEEEVRRLYENAPIGFAATLVNASILAGILRDWIEPSTLALWWGSLMALTAFRFAHAEWFRRVASKRDFDAGKWGGVFTAGIFASGLIWGAAGIWLLPESVAHQTFVAFVLGGMVAGASATFAIRMDAFVAYTLPALGPLAIRFFGMGDELHVAMGGMVVLFGVLLTATALQVHRLTSQTYDLSGELTGLQSTLRTAHRNAGSLEARLERAEEDRAALAREMNVLSEKTDERIRRYFVDITDAFLTVQERTERRVESTHARRTEEAKARVGATIAQGVAFRIRETCRVIADLVRIERRQGKVPASTRDTLRRIDVELAGAEALVDELLAYAGDLVDPETSTDVGDFLRSFARRWEASRPANIDVWWNWSLEPLLVRASPPALEILFRQLLANAREAIGEERGTIEVRARRTPSEESDGRGSFVTVEVIDDGAGMSRTTLDHLFEPFFSTKSRERGLGMAIVSSLVSRHRGRILVESAPLRGTEVRLLLPEAAAAAREEKEEEDS
ncbi:MAG TPA: ATP-binding protein [Vicinamibacteria bacterium]|nr:ATP-binding protein [Vicinamibacteria bacterium]